MTNFVSLPEKTDRINRRIREASESADENTSPFLQWLDPSQELVDAMRDWFDLVQETYSAHGFDNILDDWVSKNYKSLEKLSLVLSRRSVFGDSHFAENDNLVFVLMPFLDDLTKVYEHLIKPTVESKSFLCRRADEVKSNRAVMQDVWKAINEARIVIADLTSFNANVLYELGIAHTVGKDTILIYQRSPKAKSEFPFDLTHFRRIEYDNSAFGGQKLVNELSKTIESIVNFT
jgi:hypothetical protein